MAKRILRRSDVGSRQEELENSVSFAVVPLRPPPEAPTILRNLEASLVGVLQADVRCACHIEKVLYTADTQGTVLEWNVQDATSQIFMSGLAAPVNALVSVNKGTEMWAGLANGNIARMLLVSKSFGNQIVHAHDAAVNCVAEGSNCVWSGDHNVLAYIICRPSIYEHTDFRQLISRAASASSDKRSICDHIPVRFVTADYVSKKESLYSESIFKGGDDFLIKKWDLQGVALFSYNHHHGSIRDLLIFRNKPEQTNFELWVSSNDSTISIASVQNGNIQHELKPQVRMISGHTKAVLVLCKVGVDAIWSGSEDGSIRVWSSLAFSFKKQLNLHKGPVVSLVVMGGNVWSGSGDHTVLVWDASIFQPLFTLGDHGGYVKAMVRVEYMCWVFASGKNLKIWCARSVWETSEQQKDRLNIKMLKLKDSIDKCQCKKNSLGDVYEQAQESHAEKLFAPEKEVERAQIQLNRAQKDGAAILYTQAVKSESLENEQAEKVKELETLLKMADESNRNLADENKLLIGNINKLETETERVQSEPKRKLQDFEKSLMQAQDDLRKSQHEIEYMSKENKNNKSLRITALDKLKQAEEEKRKLVNEVVQLEESVRRNKGLADEAAETLKSSHYKQLGEMAKSLREMQNEVEQSHRKLSSELQKKDEEVQKLNDELKKKTKDLNRALRSLEDEKTGSAKHMQEFSRTRERLKKNQDAMSASERQNVMKFASLEKVLQESRNELQMAINEKSQTVERRDSDIQKLKTRVRDLKKAVKDAGNENNRLQQSFKESEVYLVGNDQKQNELQEQIDNQSTAIKTLESDLDRMKQLLQTATSERDHAGRKAEKLKTQLQNLQEELAQARAIASEQTLVLQNLSAENDNLSGKLNNAMAEKIRLEEERCLPAKSTRTPSEQALATADHKDDSQKLQGLSKDRELSEGDERKSINAPDHLKEKNSTLEDDPALATTQLEQLRNEIAIHEELEASMSKEFEQSEQRLAQALHDLEQLRKQKAAQGGDAPNMAQEITWLKQEKGVQEKELAVAAARPQQLRKKDEDIVSSVDEVSTLKRKTEVEKCLAFATQEIEQLRQEKTEVEKSLAFATQQIEQLRQEKYMQNNKKARIVGEFYCRKSDQPNEVSLVQAAEELEQLKGRTSTQEEDLKYIGDELDQLKKYKTMLEGNQASANEKIYQLQTDTNLSHVTIGQAALERQHLKKESDIYRLAKAAEELEHLSKEDASMQVDLARASGELSQLKKVKGWLEGIIARETNGLEQLSEERSLLAQADGLKHQAGENENHGASVIHMADMKDHLRNEVAMLEDGLEAFQANHEHIQKEISRLQALLGEAQDECRLTREIARCDAENAAWIIVELQQTVAELEDSLKSPHPMRPVEDALWERVRALEMALLQAHINYHSLSRGASPMCKAIWKYIQQLLPHHVKKRLSSQVEVLHPEICKRRKSNATNGIADGVRKARISMQSALHNFSKATPEGTGSPGLGETLEVAIEAVQPRFSMEYTNLKVSRCNNQKTIPRTVKVCTEMSIPRTPQVVAPPRMVPIHVPSPAGELTDPLLTAIPVSTEKERYFPSHGALRVRRGLGPASPTREYHI